MPETSVRALGLHRVINQLGLSASNWLERSGKWEVAANVSARLTTSYLSSTIADSGVRWSLAGLGAFDNADAVILHKLRVRMRVSCHYTTANVQLKHAQQHSLLHPVKQLPSPRSAA